MICSVWTPATRFGNCPGRVRRAMTTSSRLALPARSPRPLIVTSTWRAPAWTAASVFAVARPRSLWQWMLITAASPIRSFDPAHEGAELGRDGVAHGVRDVERRGTGLGDRLVHVEQERVLGARGVLGGELDLGVAAQGLAGPRHPADGLGQGLLAGDAQLVLEVDVAGGDEQVQVRALGDADGLHRALRVAVLAAGQRGDRDPAPRLLRDPADRLEVPGRGGREARLDHVHLEPGELARDLQLLRGGQPGAGRLLAVAQGGVEDPDRPGRYPAAEAGGDGLERHGYLSPPGTELATAWAWPASTTTGLRNGIFARRSAPTCSIWWFRSCSRRRAEVLAAGVLDRDPLGREGAALDVGEHVLHRGLGALGHARAGDVVAVLRGVGHAEAHEVEAAAVHEVHDQLELVHRLEVRELGLVAGLHERLERGLHQGGHAAAQEGLLAEQVGLGLLLEGGLEHARAGVAEAARVGEDAGAGGAAGVLVHGEQRRHAAALLVDGADEVARALGGDHAHVHGGRRLDPVEPDVEPVGEHEQRVGAQVGLDLGVVDGLLDRVRDGDHDHVGDLGGLGDGHDLEARGLGERAALGARGQADDHAAGRCRAGSARGRGPGDHARRGAMDPAMVLSRRRSAEGSASAS